MADQIESNIIIRTTIEKPNKAAFSSINSSLTVLRQRLEALTKTPWKIPVHLEIRSAEAQQALNQIQSILTTGKPLTVPVSFSPPGGGPSGAGPRGSTSQRTITKDVFGTPEVSKITREAQRVENGILETAKEIQNVKKGTVDTDVTLTDLQAKQLEIARRQNAELEARRKVSEQLRAQGDVDITKESTAFRARIARYDQTTQEARDAARLRQQQGFTIDPSRTVSTVKTIFNELTGETAQVVLNTRTFVKELANGEKLAVKISDATGEQVLQTERASAAVRQLAKTRQQFARAQAESAAIRTNLVASGYQLDPAKTISKTKPVFDELTGQLDTIVSKTQFWVKQMGDGRKHVVRLNDETAKMQGRLTGISDKEKYINDLKKASARLAKQQAREQKKLNDQLATEQATQHQITRLKQQGFKFTTDRAVTDLSSGRTTRQVVAVKSLGGAFSDYTLSVARANTATGSFTTETLKGSRAMKFLGDNLVFATQKVLLWIGATSGVFLVVRALQDAASAAAELEANTVFLARVGRGLVDPGLFSDTPEGNQELFEARLKAAQQLTLATSQLSAEIGGSAVEAQKAAVTFLRTGQDQEEAIKSVQAALLASRIAELDVQEATQFLTAAIQQFGLSANELLPTLDQLNTLSNNYRVSTDDLLQSISRAGSVFAEHNATLTELSAVTAVVSERTARTGTQIGNALKTIQSRLDRLDVRSDLFEKLGVSTVNLSGETRGFLSLITELQVKMQGLADSQQKELELQIAGIRQRNIFTSAIEDANRAIEAQFKALNGSGSALEEASQSARTFEAAMARLRGSFEALALTASPDLLVIAKAFINGINAILRMNQALGSIPSRLGIVVAAFFLLRRTVAAFGAILVALGSQLAVVSKQVTVQSALNFLLGKSFQSASTGALTLSNSLKVLATSSGAWTIALIGASYLLGKLFEDQSAINDLRQEGVELAGSELVKEEQKLEAIRKTTALLLEQAIARDRLTKSGQISEQQERRISQQIATTATRTGFNVSDQATTPEIIRSGIQREQTQLRETEKRQQRLLQIRLNEAAKKRKELLAVQEKLGFIGFRVDESGSLQRTQETRDQALRRAEAEDRQRDIARGPGAFTLLPDQRTADVEFGFGDTAQAELLAKQARKVAIDLDKTNDAVRELQSSLAALRPEIAGNAEELERLTNQVIAIQDLTVETKNYRKELEQTLDARKLTGATLSFASTDRELLDVQKRIEFITEEINDPKNKGLTDYLGGLSDELGDLLNVEKAIRDNREKMANQSEYLRGLYEREFSITARGAERTLQTLRTRRDRPALTDQLFGTESEQKSRLEFAQKLAAQASNVLKNGEPVAGQAQALQQTQAENLSRLRDLEIQRANEILDVEQKIAEERKKSADEIQRAVGGLGEEDKLRLIAQTQFFAANPNAQLSTTDLLLNSAASNKVTQQFYPDRIKSLNQSANQGDFFAKTLIAAGAGRNRDLVRAQQEVDQFRAGRTDEQIAQDALRRAEEFERRRLEVEGRDVLPQPANQLGLGQVDNAGQFRPNVNVAVQPGAFNLGPLVTSFEDAIDRIIRQEIEPIRERVNRIAPAVEARERIRQAVD